MWEFIVKKIFPRNPQKRSADLGEPHRVTESVQSEAVNGDHSRGEAGPLFRGGDVVKKRAKRILLCPVCSLNMRIELIDGIEIDRCNECGGIFLDRGELRSLSGTEESTLEEGNREGYLIYTPGGLRRR